MGRNLVVNVLLGLLAISTLCSAGLAVSYVRAIGELRTLQGHAAEITQRQALVQSLLRDAMAYSTHNPAIDPILQSVGAKPSPRSGFPESGD